MHDLACLIEKAYRFPSHSYVYAFEIDRQLRLIGENPITFSAHGLAGECADKERPLRLDYIFKQRVKPKYINAIYEAEMLAQKGRLSEARAHAFTNAQGAQILALNLLYANYVADRPALRLHHLNKYLNAYGLRIELAPNKALSFFHRIQPHPPSDKVEGPLVTIIMPAHNAEQTIELAVGSLLNQTWQNLQIIVVDDASTDGTLQKAKELAKRDPRVEVLSSPVNVGSYVCRNLGVLHTRGQWLTVHDADDWAFPDRIEQQVQALTAANALACTGHMLRMNEQGQITRPIPGAFTTEDGYLRLCYVSLMVQTAYFRNELGAWDSVRVGGDAELIERLKVLGTPEKHLCRPLMLCLDHEAGLTNHQVFGLYDETGQSQPLRSDYKQAFTAWHKAAGPKKMPEFGKARPFEAPTANLVKPDAIKKVFATWAKNLELIKVSEMFDAAWYKSQYPEFEQTGLDAAEHYLVHGSTGTTDPSPAFSSRFYLVSRSLKTNPLVNHLRGKDAGPDPKRVLLAAAEVAKTGAHDRGVALAEAHLPPELTYTSHILKANAALAKGDEAQWQDHLNAYLAHFNAEPICLDAREGTVFDRLNTEPLPPVTDGPLVTVIMPAWNAEKTVRKAAQSILNQTWCNLELLIVDDASTDATWSVLQEIEASDARAKIFRNKVNVGPYVSKNIALTKAKGTWISGHDADDWAHPQRLENHIRVVLAQPRPSLVSITHMLRITPDGYFNHLGQVGAFNIDGVARKASISCLFERDFLVRGLGFWDCVQFGGDSELISRARLAEGSNYQELPLIGMICQDLASSLTNNPVYGVDKQSGAMRPRLAYGKAWKTWHGTLASSNLRLEFPPPSLRIFPAPQEAVIELARVRDNLESLKFETHVPARLDVVLVTDLSFSGGNASSTIDEIEFLLARGLSVRLIDCRADRNRRAPTSPRYACYGSITMSIMDLRPFRAEVMILRHPSCVTAQQFDATGGLFSCRVAFFVINNSRILADASPAYDIAELGLRIRTFPAAQKILCPISDLIRAELRASGDADGIALNTTDWHPTFDPDTYVCPPKPALKAPFVIGRHGRDGSEKWLEDPALLRMAYTSDEGFRVSILGGAKKAAEILGSLPDTWEVIPFGQRSPKDFLRGLDVFVYFPHSGLIEAFGRSIIEAMLAGVPVILPPRFEATFGDLPLYCEPHQVADLVWSLSRDDAARVAWLTELQQIATARYSSRAIARRLAHTGLVTGSEDARVPADSTLSAASRDYRAGLLELQPSGNGGP